MATQSENTTAKRVRKPRAKKEITEGATTKMIETTTAKIPSINWLALAVGCMGLSAVTTLGFKRRSLGVFFGLWAPSLLMIGVYNKLVKVESSLDTRVLH